MLYGLISIFTNLAQLIEIIRSAAAHDRINYKYIVFYIIIIIQFIEELHTYYAAFNSSQNNRSTIKVDYKIQFLLQRMTVSIRNISCFATQFSFY